MDEQFSDAASNLARHPMQDRNLLSRLDSSQRMNTCLKLVEFNKALIKATSAHVSEAESVKILEPFIGQF
ncbi:hypothetical protein [Photorhabdus noenieputensis]|uniref:hypothetical protein n=1 Tax=Photorhabdus noenieputensis TaxID=1208607 RepID=UPI001FD0B7AE|nr:hypothetical protein [Photorhabdus noenieputensis]MCK3670443.1 hypothetical protein [Photorhabdus noenieputensis]